MPVGYAMATFEFSTMVERFWPPAAGPARYADQAAGDWKVDGFVVGQASLDPLNNVVADLPVLLLEYLRKSKAPAALYRIGQAEFAFEGGELERVK